MARIDIKSAGATLNDGVLQLQGGVAMSSTLTAVADQNDTTSPLKLSTTAVQVVSPLRITTDDPSDMYLDCEDGSTNNRFNITRNTASQQVNLNFASNPSGSTTIVGAIRTYVDGVNLSEVMSFREDGNIGIGTNSPTAILHIVYTSGQAVRNQRIGDSLNGAPTYENFKSGGVPNALTAVLANTNLGQYTWRGSTGATTQGLGARLQAWSLENFTTSSYGSRLDLSVTQLGTTTEVVMMNLRGTGVNIGNGTADIGARLGIKGSGSTSATTSLLVQNSGGTQLGYVDDSGQWMIGTGTNGGYRFDVNGTSRVTGPGSGTEIFLVRASSGNEHCVEVRGNMATSGSYFRAYKSGSDYPYEVNVNGVVIRSSGNTALNASAVLDLQSTSRGFLPPRMTDAQIRAIATPAEGLIAYNTDISHLCCYQAGAWVKLSHSPM